MWFTLHDGQGEAHGHTSVRPDPVPRGLTVIEHADRQDQTHRWNPMTRAWDIPIPEPVRVDRLTDLEQHPYVLEVWGKLTPDEAAKLRRFLAWLLGSRRYRAETEEVSIDTADDWPRDPDQVPGGR